MPSKIKLSDFTLLIKLSEEAAGGYVLEISDGPPAKRENAKAVANLPPLDHYLSRCISIHDAFERSPQGLMGDYLFEWLFVEGHPHCASFVSSGETNPPPYNDVGACLQRHHLNHRAPFRLWVCVDRELFIERFEFCGYLPFECLEHNSHLPTRVIRGILEDPPASDGLAASARSLKVGEKLRVLLVYANPDGDRETPEYRHLKHLVKHFEALGRALNPLVYRREIFVEELYNPRREKLQDTLLRFNPHAFVFAGHGYPSWKNRSSGGLILTRDGAPEPWEFPELIKTLRDIEGPALRLAVFIACRSFLAAPGLLAAGVPAVVAMQPLTGADFPEKAVAPFAEPFFRTIAHLHALTDGLVEARKALQTSSVPYASSMPTLWLTGGEDHLFGDSEDWTRAIYLDALLGKFRNLPFPGQEKGIDFDKLYIEQTLLEERSEKPEDSLQQDAPEQEMKGQVLRKQVEKIEVDLWKALENDHWVKVEAPAWTGKTTLSKWVALNSLEHGWLPIWISFRHLASREKSILSYLEEEYTEFLGLTGRRIAVLAEDQRETISLGTWLFDLWQAGKALLILDGADEDFDADRRERVLNSLPSTMALGSTSRVLLTSRPLGDRATSGFERLELKELDALEIEWLVRCCGKVIGERQKAERFIKEITGPRGRNALKLASRPGHLVQMFSTYVHEAVLARWEGELMDRTAKRRVAEISGRTEIRLSVVDQSQRRTVIETVGFHSLFCHKAEPVEPGLTLKLISQALSGMEQTKGVVAAAGKLLEDLHRNSGFFKQTQSGDYEFDSIPWLQFFAASYLARRLNEGNRHLRQWVFGRAWLPRLLKQKRFTCPVCRKMLPPFNHYFWYPDWRDTIILLAGLLEDGTPLLKRIGNERDDIFHEMLVLQGSCLGSVRKVDEAIAQEIVQAVWCQWEKNSRVGQGPALDEKVFRALADSRRPDWSDPLLAFLLEALKDENRAAARVLGEMKDPRVVPALLDALRNTTGTFSLEDIAKKYVVRITKNEDGYFGIVIVEKKQDVLFSDYNDEVTSFRKAAATTLGEMRDSRVVPALLDALKDNRLWCVHAEAVEALGKIKDSRAVPGLLDVLNDKANDGLIRLAAAEALADIGDSRVFRTLFGVVTDSKDEPWNLLYFVKDKGEPWNVLWVFENPWWHAPSFYLEDPQDILTVLNVLTNKQKSWFLRRIAADALGYIADLRAVPTLLDVLRDKDDKDESCSVRKAAARALGKIKDSGAVPGLLDVLNDKDESYSTREAAADALGQIKDLRAIPTLLDVLKGKDEPWYVRRVWAGYGCRAIRRAATRALVEISQIRGARIDPGLVAMLERHSQEEGDRSYWHSLRTLSQRAGIRIFKGRSWEPVPSDSPVHLNGRQTVVSSHREFVWFRQRRSATSD